MCLQQGSRASTKAGGREGRKLRRRESRWERTQSKRKGELVLPESVELRGQARGAREPGSQGWPLRLELG